ncbi:hypothetical protein [Bacillus sp. 1006-3]|uniref:hypothetical protein n=1 Tax=Bacillus sp. 1006-3 TaxID=2922309 RepID=UPI001F118AD6|nr:hypothetical protein [Bacillus sp. 1006-3]MCH4866691.1 hypothetical protein [Bacillus sp. 1006-3]
MFTYILWGLIIGVLILAARGLSRAAVGSAVLIGAIFFAIFILDTFTTLDVRRYVPIMFYDQTVKDPQGTASGVKNKVLAGGREATDEINDAGKRADEIYGLNEDKEWHKNEDEDKKQKTEENVQGKVSKKFIKYEDAETEIDKFFSDLSAKDKDISLSMSPIYKIKIKGDQVTVWNTGDNGEDGFYIERN